MKKASLIQSLAFAGILAATLPAHAASVKIVAQEPGGSFYSYSTTFAKTIADSTKQGITVEVVPRGGGLTNPVVVDKGQAEFGFTTANAAVWAKEGLSEAYKGKKSENIRGVINNLQIGYTMVLARKEWVEKTGHDTMEKIFKADPPPRIGLKPAGSQVPLLADYIFQAMGTSLDALRAKGVIVQVGGGQLSQMIRDGAIDVYIENAPSNQATVTEITLTTDMVFIPFPKDILESMAKVGAPTAALPAKSFKGQDTAYDSPATPTAFIVNKSVPDDVVYAVTKALVENKTYIQENHAPLKEWNPESDAQNPILELHPGAARYYREQGWLK